MSTSAFGIEHGDFAKARKIPKQPSPVVTSVHGKLKRVSAAGTKAANTPVSIAEIGRGAGRAIKATGNAGSAVLTKHPGVAGAALVGGGGYGLYRAGRPKSNKRVTQ